ncbi:hypothetical protein Tco_0664507 [Tanacetum coccineum]
MENEFRNGEYRKERSIMIIGRKCEDKIFMNLRINSMRSNIEIRKIIQEAEELRKSEARARSQKIFIDDDDDNLGFYAVHPNTIHTPVSQNIEPKDSLIMGDGHINTTPETETISVETLVSNPTCVDDDDTDDNDDYDVDFYDCVDIEEEGGEIDFDIFKIVDISLREKLVERRRDVTSFSDDSILRGIESDRDSGEDTTSIDDLPLDDSMIFSEYESFTFDDEPVMAEVNVFDEINTSELSTGLVGKGVFAITPQTLQAEWEFELRTPVVVAIS